MNLDRLFSRIKLLEKQLEMSNDRARALQSILMECGLELRVEKNHAFCAPHALLDWCRDNEPAIARERARRSAAAKLTPEEREAVGL